MQSSYQGLTSNKSRVCHSTHDCAILVLCRWRPVFFKSPVKQIHNEKRLNFTCCQDIQVSARPENSVQALSREILCFAFRPNDFASGPVSSPQS